MVEGGGYIADALERSGALESLSVVIDGVALQDLGKFRFQSSIFDILTHLGVRLR